MINQRFFWHSIDSKIELSERNAETLFDVYLGKLCKSSSYLQRLKDSLKVKKNSSKRLFSHSVTEKTFLPDWRILSRKEIF